MQVIRSAKPTYKDTLLAHDKNLTRWYENRKRGSPHSADSGLRIVGRACKLFNSTPAELAKMSVKDATDFCMDAVSELDNQGKAPKYITLFVKVLKSWFKHNGIKVEERIKIPDVKSDGTRTKVEDEVSPLPDQFARVLDYADIKQKVESTLLGFAGFREETLGDYAGKDGLKVRDLPEVLVNNETKTVTFTKIPTMVVVRRNLSKAGHQYFSFMPEQGCTYLKEMLETRMTKGEELTPDSPIITSLKTLDSHIANDSIEHITTRRIGTSIKKPIKKAGFDWRPYILRTYFDNRMLIAEQEHLIVPQFRAFFMGHTGDIEAVYTVNKLKLPSDLIEKMREAFAKASDRFVVTQRKSDATVDMVKAQFNRQFLEIAGMSAEQINTLGDLGKLSAEDMNNHLKENSKKSLGLNGNSQKVVPIAEVEKYINEGWEFVTQLPEGKVVIKLPSHA